METVVDVMENQPPLVQLEQILESEAQVEMASTLEVFLYWIHRRFSKQYHFYGTMTLFKIEFAVVKCCFLSY